MKPRILPIIALFAAVAACVYFFLSPSAPTVTTGGAGETGPAPDGAPTGAAGGKSAAGKKPVNWQHIAQIVRFDGNAGAFPKISQADIARFLAKHGETAANLVVAFEQTHDASLILRALELFPNNPMVLMAAAQSLPRTPIPSSAQELEDARKLTKAEMIERLKSQEGGPIELDAQRMALIGRFKDAAPDNPLPWLLSAGEFACAQKPGDVVAEVRAALERPAFYAYASERMESAQQLYEDIGLNPTEADFLSMASLTLKYPSVTQMASNSLMDLRKAASASGDAPAADDALRLAYQLGLTLTTPEASRLIMGQLIGMGMEKRVLQSLPADAQPEWLNATPAQRLAEIETQQRNVKELMAALDDLAQSNDEQLLAEYVRRTRIDGELSALTWLKARKK